MLRHILEPDCIEIHAAFVLLFIVAANAVLIHHCQS